MSKSNQATQQCVSHDKNVVMLRDNVFLVRTQAGFKKALKIFVEDNVPNRVCGYPRKYPSLVFLELRYNGGTEDLIVTDVHLNEVTCLE